jgi:carboxylesterase
MSARSAGPFDPEIVRPWWLGSGDRGALLLHGFAGTPPELRRLGEHLAANGWRCHGPVLAGHGTTPEALDRTRWADWADSAMLALDALVAECDRVVVAGQSMGGTLALHLAANDSRIKAVATLAAPIWLSDWRFHFIGVLKHIRRWHEPDPDDIDLYWRDAADELYSYGRRSTRSLQELNRLLAHVRGELPMVRQPVLVLQGGGDRAIDPRNADDIARRLSCSAAVERQLYPRSGHAMSVDVDRDEVNARVLAWYDRYVPAGVAESGTSPAAAAKG